MRFLITILQLILITSCATLVNKRTYPVKITSSSENDKVIVNDQVHSLPAEVTVTRSRKNLELDLLSGADTIHFAVLPSPTAAFAGGNMLWVPLAPVAYLVDLTNQRRLYYGETINLNKDDSIHVITPRIRKRLERYAARVTKRHKGDINVILSIPYANNFYMVPQGQKEKDNVGFWGMNAGLEYFYTNKMSIAITATAATDGIVAVPIIITDYEGWHETMSSVYAGITNNHKYKRLQFGYGINYSRNIWTNTFHGPKYDIRFDGPRQSFKRPEPVTRLRKAYGFIFSTHYQLRERVFVGIVYRPTLYNVYPKEEIGYEHLISLDLGWRFLLKKKR